MTAPTIAFSSFARLNSVPGRGNSYTILTEDQLVELIQASWDLRKPGMGVTTLDRKVVVPVLAEASVERFGLAPGTPFFRCSYALLQPNMPLKAEVTQRAGQTQEDFHVQTYLSSSDAARLGFLPEEAKYVKIVCYSKEALLENDGERSSNADFEIVAILASPVENEPMHCLTMARNQLKLPGGTFSEYTGVQYAEAAAYWSKRIKILPG